MVRILQAGAWGMRGGLRDETKAWPNLQRCERRVEQALRKTSLAELVRGAG
jgi:hypothetical protein